MRQVQGICDQLGRGAALLPQVYGPPLWEIPRWYATLFVGAQLAGDGVPEIAIASKLGSYSVGVPQIAIASELGSYGVEAKLAR